MGSKSSRSPGNTPAVVALERAKVEFRTHEYELTEERDTYGESVAATLGVDANRLYKTLVANVDGQPAVGIVQVSGQLSLKALAAAAGGKRAKMADPADAERWTGYVTGGISPFGQKKRLAAFVDASLESHETVFVSGGRRGLQVEVAPADLVRVLGATVASGLGVS